MLRVVTPSASEGPGGQGGTRNNILRTTRTAQVPRYARDDRGRDDRRAAALRIVCESRRGMTRGVTPSASEGPGGQGGARTAALLLLWNLTQLWRDTNSHAANARGVKAFAQKKYEQSVKAFGDA